MPLRLNLFDCHCDSVTAGKLLAGDGHLKIADAKRFGKYLQVFAICPENEYAYSHARHYIRKYHRLMRVLGMTEVLGSDGLDVPRGAILALEGADAFCGNLAAVRHFYGMGVRLVTITWNNNNAAGESIMSASGGGLTDFGRQLVRECEQLGIAVDLSHLSDKGFDDVCEIAEKPFICSHSDSRAVNGAFARNITDGQFKEIIRRGGAAGINFCTDFLGGDKGTGAVLSHIEHFLSLGGEKNIGLGSDFDGIPCLPHGCRGVEYAADIAEELLKRNYKEEIVYDILYGNFLRIFKQIFK